MGMVLAKRRTVAALAATAVVASGALWAPAAQAAPTCVDVPGGTLGSTVKVGPVEQRIPAVSGIRLCAEGSGALPFRTDDTGGLTVYVGGGTATVATVTVSGCQAVPDIYEEWGNNAVSFCGDPTGWIGMTVDRAYTSACGDTNCNPIRIVCAFATEPC